MEVIEKSVVGNYRNENEDNTLVVYNGTDQALLLLADGMGGHRHGAVASQFVKDEIKKMWQEENLLNVNEAEKFIKDLVMKVNKSLYDYQLNSEAHKGMGTTLVLALFIDKTIIVVNVGDSRCYVMNARSIEQVTKDHSFVELLVETGEITREEAFNHPKKNIVTKSMGTERRVQADVYRLRNKQYDYLLLTSDGLTDVVKDSEIHEHVMRKQPLEDKSNALIETALNHDSKDNVSIILADLKAGVTY